MGSHTKRALRKKKKNKKKKNKKGMNWIFIVVLLVVLCIAGYFVYTRGLVGKTESELKAGAKYMKGKTIAEYEWAKQKIQGKNDMKEGYDVSGPPGRSGSQDRYLQ